MDKLQNIKESVFSDFSLNDFILDESNLNAFKQVQNWIDSISVGEVKHLQICGPCGDGKTHLAAGALNHLAAKDNSFSAYHYLCFSNIDLEKIPSKCLILWEGPAVTLEKYATSLLEKCSELGVSVIFTSDKRIESVNDICVAEIQKPTETLLQKIAAAALKDHSDIKIQPDMRSARATLASAKKEIFKKELGVRNY